MSFQWKVLMYWGFVMENRYEIPIEIPSHFVWEKDLEYAGMVLKDMQVIDEGCVALLLLNSENQFLLYYPDESEQKYIEVPLPKSEKPKAYGQSKSGEQLFAYARGNVALIYDNKEVKFFNTERKTEAVIVKLPSEAVKIITKDQKFYLLLKNKKIFVYALDGTVMVDEPADKKIFELKKPKVENDVSIGAYGRDCLENIWLINENTQELEYYLKTLAYEDDMTLEHTFIKDNAYTVWSNLYIEWDRSEGTEVEIEVHVDSEDPEIFSQASNILLYDYVGTALSVKVTLKSDSKHRKTPKIYALRVKIDQKRYSDYLPAYYQQDKEVLSRYLSIFQDIMGDFEHKIEKSEVMLDPQKCDEEYLEWLSTLLGTTMDHRWEEQAWRDFLSALPELYKTLGTKESMEKAIFIYCGERPEIDDAIADSPWTFCVQLSDEIVKNHKDVSVIESIIEAFKPAHTIARLAIGYDKEAFTVGDSFLTLNTKIK